MEASELARVDGALRQLCVEHVLNWIIDAVDTAAAEGFTESVAEGSSIHGWRRGDDLYRYGMRPEERSRVEPEIVHRPYSDTERVLILLDAMLAVYRDLPDLRAETVRVLTDGFQGRVPVPDQIVTALDEDNEEDVISWRLELEIDAQSRQRVVGALIALRRAVSE